MSLLGLVKCHHDQLHNINYPVGSIISLSHRDQLLRFITHSPKPLESEKRHHDQLHQLSQ